MKSDFITISLLDQSRTALPTIQDPQLLYVLRKECALHWGDARFALSSGDFFLVNSLQSCSYNLSSPNSLVAVFRISYDYLSEQLGNPLVSLRCLPIHSGKPLHSELQRLTNQILQYYISTSAPDRFRLKAAYHELMFLLINSFMRVNTSAPEEGKMQKRISSILQYLHQNYNKPITLQMLANQFYLTSPYLSRLLKKNLGCNFLEYLNQLRLGHAVTDLENTDHTISQIAFEHGFSNVAAFNRVFRETYGQTPSAYRKQHAISAQPDNSQQALRRFLEHHPFQVQRGVQTSTMVCRADAAVTKSLHKHWQDTLNLGVATDLTTSRIQNQILLLKKKIGFRYGHVWCLFCEETLIDVNSPSINFSQLDLMLDFLVESDIIPFLDLGFRTKSLVLTVDTFLDKQSANYSRMQQTFYTHPSRIKNPIQYQNLISKFLKHCIQRYGVEAVSRWRFLLHCEDPSNNTEGPSWVSVFSNLSRYLEKYLPAAQLGISGIITFDDNKIFEKFIANAAEQKLLPDFIGINIYPYSLAQQESFNVAASFDESFLKNKLRTLQTILKQYGLPNVSLYVMEWNFSFSSRNFIHDSVYKGAYIVKNMIESVDQVPLISYWGCLDLLQDYYDSSQPLCGAAGLLCKSGIPKPSFYAFFFLSNLKNQLLAHGANYIITSDTNSNYSIVCHNCRSLNRDYYYEHGEIILCEKVDTLFDTATIVLDFYIKNVHPGQYTVKKRYINQDAGNLLSEWVRIGKPSSITADDREYLSAVSTPHQIVETVSTEESTLMITSTLKPNEIQLLEIVRELG